LIQFITYLYIFEYIIKSVVFNFKIFDILSWYFGKRIPKAILTYGSGTFIAERFLFESVKDDLKIVLPSELEDSYFKILTLLYKSLLVFGDLKGLYALKVDF
jgi:hypothetical protein